MCHYTSAEQCDQERFLERLPTWYTNELNLEQPSKNVSIFFEEGQKGITIYLNTYMYVSMYICMYVCMYVCMQV
jgi:hypothetical protein